MTALRERRILAGALCLGIAYAAGGQERRPPARVEPGPVPTVPAALADHPRLLVSDVATPSPGPLIVRLRSEDGGESACYDVRFRGTGVETVVLPVPGSDRKVTLIELAFDPARRVRHLFYDAGPESRGPILSASAETSGVLSFGFGQMELGGPENPECGKPPAGAPSGANRLWQEGDGPNAGAFLARVELLEEGERPVWGWCLAEGGGGGSSHSAVRNPSGGARQEWSVTSYFVPGGDAIAIALAMSADWIDPRDGRVYRYLQYASGGFAPLKKEAQPVLRLAAGAAAPRPIELVVYSEEEWPGCASRAAERR
jgi:hypothetical protein